jgi:hypothetical protein
MRFIVSILLSLLAVNAYSGVFSRCITDEFRDTIRDVKSDDLLTAADRQKIKDIFENTQLTDSEKAQLSFQVFVDARLRTVPAEDIPAIKEIIDKAKQQRTWRSVNGSYRPITRQITLQSPKMLQDTIIEKATFIHEIEHAIQDSAGRRSASSLRWLKEFFAATELSYLSEEGAMISELRYTASIPIEERKRMIRELESASSWNIDKRSKKFVIRQLKSADKEIEDYLDTERKAGRYSKRQVFLHEAQKKFFLANLFIPVTMLASDLIACPAMISKDGDFSGGDYFDKICLHIYGYKFRKIIQDRLGKSQAWQKCNKDSECLAIPISCGAGTEPPQGSVINSKFESKIKNLYPYPNEAGLSCSFPKPKCSEGLCNFPGR